MPGRVRRPPVALLRRVLLALLALGVVTIVVVFALRRDPAPAVARPAGGPIPEAELTLIGEGFEFTQSEEDKPVFHIRGESIKVRRGNVVLLEDVGITIYDEEGTPYHLEADEARYDREAGDATLEGSLRLMGPDGMVLTADELLIRNQGQSLQTAGGPVEVLYGGIYRGTANRFVARLRGNVFALAGNAEVTRLDRDPQPVLRAASITFERDESLVAADQDVSMTRGEDVLTSDKLIVFLTPEEGDVEAVRAREAVDGHLVFGGPGDGELPALGDEQRQPSAMQLRGDSLMVFFDQSGRAERAELEGLPGAPATLVSKGAGGLEDTLTAAKIETRIRPDGGQDVTASGSPRLVETVRTAEAAGPDDAAPPLRLMTAARMTAVIGGDGGVERLDAYAGVGEGPLAGDVIYRDADVVATGERLAYAAGPGQAELTGSPVHVVSERGEVWAPQVVWEQESGLLRAEGGTRTTIAEGSAVGLEGSPLDAGEGPVQVESETAFWRDEPAAVLFRGGVRAWRGESLLLADELRGDRLADAEVLKATGGVRTVWTGAPGEGAPGNGAGEQGEALPVEVTAGEMTYRRPLGREQGTVVYRQQVRAEQGERLLLCRELEIDLTEEGQAETLTCTGQVKLEDRAAQNVATGERAVYELAERTIDITGEPVVLTRADGSQVQGRRVLYDVDAARARVLSGPGAAEAAPPAEATP